ncbi:unnamed protein product [Diamesa serratosioi]
MLERRSLMSLFIGLTLCVSVWHIAIQQHQQFVESTPAAYAPATSSAQALITNKNQNFYNESHVTTSSLTTVFSAAGMLDQLSKTDYNQLIDLNDFEFEINQKVCSDRSATDPPLLLILVHSAPLNYRKRITIRDTWGNAHNESRSVLIFLIGSVNDTQLQSTIEIESNSYGDMVQGNVYDAYRNLTYKHVMALKWFIYHCPDAQYILKTDDDVFVNTPMLFNYLEALNNNPGLLWCKEVKGERVKRTYRSKWRVSFKEFDAKYYKNHCPGFSIVYSPDVAFQLYNEAQQMPYFWIDDVHLTGTVATKSNITITPFGNLYADDNVLEDLLKINTKLSNQFMFAYQKLKEKDVRKLWKDVTVGRRIKK